MNPVDVLNMKVTLTILIDLMWKDPRLSMESLNFAETLNIIQDKEAMWRPQLVFTEKGGSEVENLKQWEQFRVVMQSKPLRDDITRVREGNCLV